MKFVISAGRVFFYGVAFGTGIVATALLAVALSGTLTTFQTGDLISASKINANFTVIENTIGGLNSPPVGSIVAWHKDFANTPALPDGWVECDGTAINDTASVYHGQNTPNLNGDGRFLRGSPTSGTPQADSFRSHNHAPGSGNWFHAFQPGGSTGGGGGTGLESFPATTANTGGTETRPINMSVVYIMRIR